MMVYMSNDTTTLQAAMQRQVTDALIAVLAHKTLQIIAETGVPRDDVLQGLIDTLQLKLDGVA